MNSHQEHFDKEAFMVHFKVAVQFKSKGSKRSRNLRDQAPGRFVIAGAQSRFVGESAWADCSVEHHEFIQSDKAAWPGYETRLVYAQAEAKPKAPKALVSARKPSLAKAGEVLGSGLPDWPAWCEDFDTRLAYQQGVADCRVADNKVAFAEVTETLRGVVGALKKALPYLPADVLAVHCGEWLSEGAELLSKLKGQAELAV